jgi:hypothetical protein
MPPALAMTQNKFLLATPSASEVCVRPRQHDSFRFASGSRMIPKSGVRFSDQIMRQEEGGGAPKGASSLKSAPHREVLPLTCARARKRIQRDALAFRRSTAALARGFRPAGSTPGHASWDAVQAGVTRPFLSQSRDCTSRIGRSTGVNDARSRPGAECKSARGNRSRSVFGCASRTRPSIERNFCDVT